MSDSSTILGLRKVFLENREIHIKGEMTEETSDYVHESLLHLKAAGSPDIIVFFRSIGGHLDAGLQIYDEFRHYAGNVRGVAQGYVYSAAAIAIQGCAQRLAYRHTKFLVHEGEFHARLVRKDLSKKGVDEMLRDMDESIEQMQKILKFRTGLSLKRTQKLLSEDKIITAVKAVELGLLDGLV